MEPLVTRRLVSFPLGEVRLAPLEDEFPEGGSGLGVLFHGPSKLVLPVVQEAAGYDLLAVDGQDAVVLEPCLSCLFLLSGSFVLTGAHEAEGRLLACVKHHVLDGEPIDESEISES